MHLILRLNRKFIIKGFSVWPVALKAFQLFLYRFNNFFLSDEDGKCRNVVSYYSSVGIVTLVVFSIRNNIIYGRENEYIKIIL